MEQKEMIEAIKNYKTYTDWDKTSDVVLKEIHYPNIKNVTYFFLLGYEVFTIDEEGNISSTPNDERQFYLEVALDREEEDDGISGIYTFWLRNYSDLNDDIITLMLGELYQAIYEDVEYQKLLLKGGE